MKRITKYSVTLVKESTKLYDFDNLKASSSMLAYGVVKQVLNLDNSPNEIFGILALDVKNNVIGVHPLFHGGLCESFVSPRDAMRAAILNNAKSIILFHNHPSGDCIPSKEDRECTQRMKDAGKIMDVSILDHIIVGGNSYYSFAEHGML